MENSSPDPYSWLFFADSSQRSSPWLEELREGGYVFWHHGSNAHTKRMHAGDTILIYLAGTKGEPGEVTAIGTIAAVRSPFILDNENRTQRLPCLITIDLRRNPIPWQAIRELVDEPPVSQQGAVHPVKPDVIKAIHKLTKIPLPASLEDNLSHIRESGLWRVLEAQREQLTVLPEFISAQARQNTELEGLPRVSSPEEFEILLQRELEFAFQSRHETRLTGARKAQGEDESEFDLSDVIPDGEIADLMLEEQKGAPTEDGDFDFEQFVKGSKAFAPSPPAPEIAQDYTSPALYTAGSIADRVTGGQEDHLRVDIEARAFARLIASESSKPPLSVGIFGRWGSGKSFFMNRIGEELDIIADDAEDGFHDGIVQVEFNAWHYMETNVWASLVDVIFKVLDTRIRSDKPDSGESLFDQLSTAQNLRLDAIDNLIKAVVKTSEARQAVKLARQDFEQYGPDGKQLWGAVIDGLGIRDESGKNRRDIERAAELLGNEQFTADVTSIRNLADNLKVNLEEGRLAWNSLRQVLTNPIALISLAVLLIVIPYSINWLLSYATDTPPNLLISATSTLAAWGAAVGVWVKKGVTLLTQVNNKIAAAHDTAIADHQTLLDEAELKLEGARQSLETAEEQVQDALQALVEESPGARLASFIKQRAESDDYTKHLGVIATIRSDFEQLSELMSAASAKDNRKELEKFRQEIGRKLDNLKKGYPRIFSDNASESNAAHTDLIVPESELNTIREKVAALETSLETRLGPQEKPFTRIVLKIDDLDRCPHDKVADVLQAVHLFLNFPLFVILVCVDERWMSTSLVKKFGTLVDGSGGATTSDYLEKIFQIPYWTRPMTEESSGEFAGYLIADIVADSEPVQKPQMPPHEKIDKEVDDIDLEESGEEVFSNTGLVSEPNTKGPGSTSDDNESPEKKGEPESEDTADSEIESADTKVPYTRLTLSSQESTALKRLAGFAGDTPRRTLRFVNVYLLIKSSMEPGDGISFRDVTGSTFGHQSLLMQLALATRADAISRYYYTELDRFKNEVARLPEDQAKKSLKASMFLQSLFENKNSKEDSKLTDQEFLRGKQVLEVFLSVCGFETEDLKSSISQLSRSEGDGRLIIDLLATESLARRYTFTPQNIKSKPSPHNEPRITT